jgi:hypothetical protein
MAETAEAIIDRAQTAREIGMLVALMLLESKGDGQAALELCADISHIAPPEEDGELNAPVLAAEAINAAMTLRGEMEPAE